MRIDQRGRGGGKTYDLMWKLVGDPDAVVVVHSYGERDRLQKDYPTIKNQIYCIDSVISGKLRGKKISVIHVDNLDLILPFLLGNNRIGTVTLTPED